MKIPRRYKNDSVRNLEILMVLFGFIWNLFEWGFKLESAFKFESNLKKRFGGK
jgi:hypothetical protein